MRDKVLYINNRYRHYDRLKYQTLTHELAIRVLWISPAPVSDPLPAELARELPHLILSRRFDILKPWHLWRGIRLVALVVRHGVWADLVVTSGSTAWKSRIAYLGARLVGTRFAIRVERWWQPELQLGLLKRLYWGLQDRLARHLETHADTVFVGGIKAREYMESRGVAGGRIRLFNYLHDDLADYPLDEGLMARLRERLGDGPVFLYLGRIMPQKGLHLLIEAFQEILAAGLEANLLIVGEPIARETGRGARSVEYEEACVRLAGGDRRIVFWGSVAPQRANCCYRVSDVFVHPHVRFVDGVAVHEGWGNVVTEAASMSLPIIATDRVPSAFDVVRDGESGFLLRSPDLKKGLFEAMRFFTRQPGLIGAFGERSRRRYEQFVSPRRTVQAVREAIGGE